MVVDGVIEGVSRTHSLPLKSDDVLWADTTYSESIGFGVNPNKGGQSRSVRLRDSTH